MIDDMRALGTLPERVAKLAAPKIEAALRASAAAGTSPTGAPWAPRKKDGGRAMAGAASAISVEAIGPVVRVKLTGPEVFHHYAARGETRRQVIPDTGIDAVPAVANALDAALEEATR